MNRGRSWTPTEDETVRRMVGGKHTEARIAVVLCRTPNDVRNRKRVLGVRKYHVLSDAERLTLVAAFAAGESDAEADRRIGRAHGTRARDLRKKLGLPGLGRVGGSSAGWKYRKSVRNLPPQPTRERVMDILTNGPLTVREIHARYGRGLLHTMHMTLHRLRRDGKAVCEGGMGPVAPTWFSVGWWLSANEGLVHMKAHALRRRFPSVDVEDIVSQLRVEIARCAKSFRLKGWKFSTYVLDPASASTADWCRLQRNRGVYVPKSALNTTGLMVADHELLPGGRYERTRTLPDAPVVDPTFWDRAVGVPTLTPRERDIVVAHFRDGETQESIGRRYGVTKSAIQASAERALRKIRGAGALDDYAEAI